MRRTLTLAVFYFAAVFGAGFIFGVIRTLLVAPAVGESTAELIEAPFMLGVIVAVAWLLSRRHREPRSELAIAGAVAALLVLAADLAVGIGLRGLSAQAVLFEREPLTGSVYYVLIALFAAMPYLLARFAPKSSAA